MTSPRKLYPTTTGVSLGDLGLSLVTLARNVAGIGLPVLQAKNPLFMSWAVTEACNLGCTHCSMNRPLPDELKHEERLIVARRLAESEAWGVSLIGGEPLLVKELFEYVRILKAAGKRVFIGTSGDRLGKVIDEVLASGVDVLTLGVDGEDAEAHDRFRDREGLFARVVDAIDTLVGRRRGPTPKIQIRCTINRHNFRQIGTLLDFWQQHADNVLLQAVQNNGMHQVRDPSCLFQPEDRIEFEAHWTALRTRYPFLRGRYFELMPRYLFEPEALQRDIGFRCLLVPATTAVVEANGRVKLCHARPDAEVGSLVTTSLPELWQAQHTAETRRRMQSKEYGCMCWESAYADNLDLVAMGRFYESVTERLSGAFGG